MSCSSHNIETVGHFLDVMPMITVVTVDLHHISEIR